MRSDSIKLADTVTVEDSTLVADSLAPADSTDSLVTEKKKPVEPGSIEGTFRDSMNIGGPYLARFLDNSGSVVATTPVAVDKSWVVDSIPPGTYAVDIVVDENNNGKYDHGRPSPFTFSERWYPLQTTVVVRQRWTTEGIELVLRR